MKIKDELEALGYRLIRLSTVDKKRDPLLQGFMFKTLPMGAGSHGYFRSLADIQQYVVDIKLIRG